MEIKFVLFFGLFILDKEWCCIYIKEEPKPLKGKIWFVFSKTLFSIFVPICPILQVLSLPQALPTKLLALLQASSHDGKTITCPLANPHKNLTVRLTYMSREILQHMSDFSRVDWLRAMVDKSTDHGNNMMVVQFVFHFLAHTTFQEPWTRNGHQKSSKKDSIEMMPMFKTLFHFCFEHFDLIFMVGKSTDHGKL